jgi:hypothetical protein
MHGKPKAAVIRSPHGAPNHADGTEGGRSGPAAAAVLLLVEQFGDRAKAAPIAPVTVRKYSIRTERAGGGTGFQALVRLHTLEWSVSSLIIDEVITLQSHKYGPGAGHGRTT